MRGDGEGRRPSPASTPSAFSSSVIATSYAPMFDGVMGTALMRLAETITSIHAGIESVIPNASAEEREHRRPRCSQMRERKPERLKARGARR